MATNSWHNAAPDHSQGIITVQQSHTHTAHIVGNNKWSLLGFSDYVIEWRDAAAKCFPHRPSRLYQFNQSRAAAAAYAM